MVAADLPTVEEHIRHRLALAVGGWRGSLEAAVPTVVFVVLWTWRHELRMAIGSALAVAVVLAVARLVQRSSVQYALSALVGIGIAAVFALRSGRAEDAFLPGMLYTGVIGVVALVSILTRWPLVGFMVGAAEPAAGQDPFGWHRHPDIVGVCSRLTWVLVVLSVIRTAIMLPLYLAGQVTALGIAKIVLGWPAWAAAVAVMGVLLARGRTPWSGPPPQVAAAPLPESATPPGLEGSADPG